MFSSVTGWKAGDALWSVTHDCEKGKAHLEVEGPVPLQLAGIQNKLLADQAAEGGEEGEVDFLFDAPIQLAKELTGFRFDEDVPGVSRDLFVVLEKDGKPSGGWLGGLFDKKDK